MNNISVRLSVSAHVCYSLCPCLLDWLAHDTEEDLCPGTQLCAAHRSPDHQSGGTSLHGVSVYVCICVSQSVSRTLTHDVTDSHEMHIAKAPIYVNL